MTKYWIAVASAEHARRGKAGFMQVNHGKKTPLQRIRAGDGVTYYSPAETIRGKDRLQSFTTIGSVRDEELYQGEMGGDFTPWRRNVDYADAIEAPIAPLLDTLDFTRGNRNWGYQMRLGLFEISEHDFRAIAEAMHAEV
ncbi:EVE domain-containing protein [Devosia sp. BK]|uniref:EVE domain-containing protein n=1 Tax=Devosia sp. BK TaxID=2871706 RepID=UPI002939B5F9|nr:EVE domain-containing protein [Devosia sp. BK]MDV3250581.1 EVE domain-containing protein [Devosia sp. BK]